MDPSVLESWESLEPAEALRGSLVPMAGTLSGEGGSCRSLGGSSRAAIIAYDVRLYARCEVDRGKAGPITVEAETIIIVTYTTSALLRDNRSL